MKAKVFEGARVNGKNGIGTITSIITKSTGYVMVSWDNEKTSKDMAFNLTNVDGELLKSKPASNASEKLAEKLYITSGKDKFYENADGSFNHEAWYKQEEVRRQAARESISW